MVSVKRFFGRISSRGGGLPAQGGNWAWWRAVEAYTQPLRIWEAKADVLERRGDGEARQLAQAYRTWAQQYADAGQKASAITISPPINGPAALREAGE